MTVYELLLQKEVSQVVNNHNQFELSDTKESKDLDVNDPEMCFSFAKDYKSKRLEKVRSIKEYDVVPKNLFDNEVLQFRSDKMHNNKKVVRSAKEDVSEFRVRDYIDEQEGGRSLKRRE